MSAIAFELPPEVREACEGLVAFARAEVMPRHEKHRDLLEDPRKLYREDGRFSDQAVALNSRRAARGGEGGILLDVRSGSARRRRPRSPGLLRGLGTTIPAMWSAELANALCNQSL